MIFFWRGLIALPALFAVTVLTWMRLKQLYFYAHNWPLKKWTRLQIVAMAILVIWLVGFWVTDKWQLWPAIDH
jgi:hypothetical protein